ncbi:hypothetical protein [Novosphingopyxis sp.]|uniref:hypothetical protein n=1 Tax=Novosphingopyxis sp. TaxID=2709690 RepID=UPI003B5C8B79
MSDPETWLGGRLPLLSRSELSPAQVTLAKQVDPSMGTLAERLGVKAKTAEGRSIRRFNPMLQSPEIALAFLQLQTDEGRLTNLSDRVRQVAILSVGSGWQAPYELYAHAAVAHQAGVSAKCVNDDLNADVLGQFGEKELVALRCSPTAPVSSAAYSACWPSPLRAGVKNLSQEARNHA